MARRTGPEHSQAIDHIARMVLDRKSTRLNSSHTVISYAVFCLKKKKGDKTHRSPLSNRIGTKDHVGILPLSLSAPTYAVCWGAGAALRLALPRLTAQFA